MSPWLEHVLSVMADLCGPQNKPIASSFLGEHLGKSRRTASWYLSQLEAAQLVTRPHEKARRWCVAGYKVLIVIVPLSVTLCDTLVETMC